MKILLTVNMCAILKYVVFKALLVLLQYIVHIDIFICAIALTEPEITLIDQIRALKHTLVL